MEVMINIFKYRYGKEVPKCPLPQVIFVRLTNTLTNKCICTSYLYRKSLNCTKIITYTYMKSTLPCMLLVLIQMMSVLQ